MNRRNLLAALAAAAATPRLSRALDISAIVQANDSAVDTYLKLQNTDPNSRFSGALVNGDGLHEPASAGGVLVRGVAAFFSQQSKHHRSAELRRRMKLAVDHLLRVQTPDGNIDLLATNFNSPPDLGFTILNVGMAAQIAIKEKDQELLGWMEPFLRKAGGGLAKGGVHTPNHRWVVCGALSHIHTVFPDASYVRRIDQWLAEGIDIDADGQFSERSTTVYNAVTDNAFVEMAFNLKRENLLAPVRRNLESMLYLLHPGYEVVTDISRRQDRNTVAGIGRYWLPLRYLANKDRDGRFETLARTLEPQQTSLAHIMVYPELSGVAPAPTPVPDNYEKQFPAADFVRIRRGITSASITLRNSDMFFCVRRGEAVINAVRFATAFFGKGQFVPMRGSKQGDLYRLEQELEAAYYQPLDTPKQQPAGVDSWTALRAQRRTSEINRIRYAAEIRERPDGFDVRLQASGTSNVPLAVEINVREGGSLTGVEAVQGADQSFILPAGKEAIYTKGSGAIRIGPGLAETRYVQVRGALPKLHGPSVYLTGFTPFDHTLQLRWS